MPRIANATKQDFVAYSRDPSECTQQLRNLHALRSIAKEQVLANNVGRHKAKPEHNATYTETNTYKNRHLLNRCTTG